MARAGPLQYGVNVFKDGKTIIQSMRPGDHRARVGAIDVREVNALLVEARASHFAEETDACDFATDSEVLVLG